MSKILTTEEKARLNSENIKERTVLNLSGLDSTGAQFSSGSVGYRPLSKVVIDDAPFQVTGTIVKIGTKLGEGVEKPANGTMLERFKKEGIKTRTVVDLKDVAAVGTISKNSGSVGYFIYGKTTIDGNLFQLSVRATKIGTKTQ